MADQVYTPAAGDENLAEQQQTVQLPPKKPVDIPVSGSSQPPEDVERQLKEAEARQQAFFLARREQKKRLLMFRRIRLLLKLALSVGFIVGVWQLIVAPWWVFKEPRFTLKQHHLIQDAHITPLLASWMGRPLFLSNPDTLARQLEQRYPMIDKAVVRRFFLPPHLEISLAEKMPWGELYPAAGNPVPYAALTGDYRPISLKDYDYTQEAPLIYSEHPAAKLIIPANSALLGQPRRLLQVHRLAYQLQTMKGLNFKYLDLQNIRDITAVFDEVSARIGTLDSNTASRVERLVPLTPTIMGLLGQIDWVDLRWSQQVTLHKRHHAESDKVETASESATPTAVDALQPQPIVAEDSPPPTQEPGAAETPAEQPAETPPSAEPGPAH